MKEITKAASIRGLDASWTGPIGVERSLFTNSKNTELETLYRVVKGSPEVMACIQAIVEDIMADGWKFYGTDDKKIEEANKFSKEVGFYKILTNAVWETILTGNSYLLKLSVNESEIKEIITEMSKEMLKEYKAKKLTKTKVAELVKQKTEKPKDIQLLKSSTMTINYDETGVISSYQQRVGGNTRVYLPEDIIHISLVNVGGEPYGFSPLEPLLSDIATLIYAKEYAGKYFENDGAPAFIFNMPNENPESPNYKNFLAQLQKLKKTRDKFKSIVTTGEINSQQIIKFNKDLEYEKLIKHFTNIVLSALGVPAKRINMIFEKDTASGNARDFEGYYKRINFLQRIIADKLNSELWTYFDAEMRFNEAYKLDEMREAQIAQIASQAGFMTIEEIRDRFGLNPEMKGNLPKRLGDDTKINFEQDKKAQRGQVQEPEPKIDNKLKEIKPFSLFNSPKDIFLSPKIILKEANEK